MRHGLLARALLLPTCTLAACTLIDQRTFNPDAGKPPVSTAPQAAAPRPVPPGPPPLLTVDMAKPDADAVASALAKAVAAARARKPGVVFDVVQIVPPSMDPGATTGQDAAAVAGLIQSDGVPASRINLFARPEAGASSREVRVYVR